IAADDASAALDLGKLPRLLRGTDPNEPPPRYRLRVWLEATDNAAAGPHTGRSEPFTFVVLSEFELLSEIANEEESLQLNLEDRLRRLREAQLRLRQLNAMWA